MKLLDMFSNYFKIGKTRKSNKITFEFHSDMKTKIFKAEIKTLIRIYVCILVFSLKIKAGRLNKMPSFLSRI